MDARYLSLATFRANGAEVATPVWFAPVDGAYYVFTLRESGKMKRLRRSSRARVAPCDARGTITGEWRDATARIVTDRTAISRANAALVAKYGWQKRLLEVGSWISGRIRRRAWIAIEL
jgi:uncharacterized protein